MVRFLAEVGATPGRSGHRLSLEAGRIVLDVREKVARLFNAAGPLRVVLTCNATEALNLVLTGLLRPGDHVLATGLEHNSVMRPLSRLAGEGVVVSPLSHGPDGALDLDDVRAAMRGGPRLVVVNHASNVTGRVQPVAEIAELAHERGALVLVDAAQSAGCVPIDIERDGIDFLAFPGHKSLYGPQGTGGLVFGRNADHRAIRPLKTGGTGSRSEHLVHPEGLPDRFEAGTPNAVGLAGLGAGLDFVLAEGVDRIRDHEEALCVRLVVGLSRIPGVLLHGLAQPGSRTATVSFTMEGLPVSQVGLSLDEEFGVLARVGLHCAPEAHRTTGTFPSGTVRFSLGRFNTTEHVDAAVAAVAALGAK